MPGDEAVHGGSERVGPVGRPGQPLPQLPHDVVLVGAAHHVGVGPRQVADAHLHALVADFGAQRVRVRLHTGLEAQYAVIIGAGVIAASDAIWSR